MAQSKRGPSLAIKRGEAAAALQGRIDKGRNLAERDYRGLDGEMEEARREFRRWSEYNQSFLMRAFTEPSIAYQCTTTPTVSLHWNEPTPSQKVQRFRDEIHEEINRLVSVLERLDLFEEFSPSSPPALPSEPSNIVRVVLMGFHRAAIALRTRRQPQLPLMMDNEYDVQYLLNAMLRIHFEDVRPEEWTPSYAGGSSRIDFFLPHLQQVIEVKRTRTTLRDKEIGDELLIDIARYKTHTAVTSLMCFVYDPDHHIVNPSGLAADLEKQTLPSFRVNVVIAPGI